MSKKMLINASHPEENRVAIVVDGILSELDIEIAGQQQTKGNIYKAVVVRVEPGLQAAFVDYGAAKHGFLQIGEIHPNLHPPKKSAGKEYPRINEILHRGQEILVQVVKGERGTKGAALTTLLSLPGRYMVLMPDSSTKGVSRKIQDDKERKTLKKTMAQLDLPDEMGYIVRTAGIGKEEAELKRDFNYLVSLYKGILSRKEKVKAPAQLYQESDIVIRSIRDYFSTEMDEVLIDDSEVYRQARDFFSLVMPDQLHLVKQHREKRPIFSRYQIEEQIESLARNQVPLPSGGSIVIDQTEALVAIDVNSGRMAGEKGIEATAARSNIEAAAEIGRQLRLRDLGGLIVIDFIDMRDRKKVREVEQTLKESVKDDKARISTARISQFGLLELSRQRIRPTLSVGAYLDCPHCKGKGRIKSPEAQAVALLRQLHAAVSKGQIGTIKALIPLDVANYLHNDRRQALTDLEKRFDLKIEILASLDAIPEQIELDLIKREKPPTEDPKEVPVSHAEGLEQALAAANEPEAVTEIETATDVTPDETSESATPTEEAAVKRKRRRRRRRRGGANRSNDSSPTESQINGESPASPEEQAPETESFGTENETAKIQEDKSAQPVRQPTTHKVDKPTSDGPAELLTEKTSTPPAAEEKPKRRTRRPAAKKAKEAATEATTDATPATTTESSAPAEEKPKRRTRRPAAKKAQETSTEATTDTTPVTTAESSAPAEEKPKRRTRKPAAQKTQEASTGATAETTPAAKAENSAAVEEKPKRRTRKPAAKKAQEASTGATTDTTPAAKAENSAAVEEKPKRRTRKPAAKKAQEGSTGATADTAPAAKAESSAAVEEKPKRRTRKPAAKKTQEGSTGATADTTPAAKAESSAAVEEKPKRRTRKPAAKKTQEGSTGATADTTPAAKAESSAAVEEKPKRRTRKPVAKKNQE